MSVRDGGKSSQLDFENRSITRIEHLTLTASDVGQVNAHDLHGAALCILLVERMVLFDRGLHLSLKDRDSLVQQKRVLAQRAHRGKVVRDKYQRGSIASKLAHLGKAFLLEVVISHAEHLVYDQYFGIDMRSHGEAQPGMHA